MHDSLFLRVRMQPLLASECYRCTCTHPVGSQRHGRLGSCGGEGCPVHGRQLGSCGGEGCPVRGRRPGHRGGIDGREETHGGELGDDEVVPS